MEFKIKSNDGVFTIGMYVYKVGDDLFLYVDDYKVEDEITNQYKEQLLELINKAKEEMVTEF